MWYDLKESLLDEVRTLKGLNALIEERYRAGYLRKERLNTFCILGTYMLDSCGNCGTIDSGFIPREKIVNLPRVVTHEELYCYIREYDLMMNPLVLSSEEMQAKDFDFSDNKRPYPSSISYHYEVSIPRYNKVCPICGRGWTIENCWDTSVRNDRKTANTQDEEFRFLIGKTIKSLESKLSERTDSCCWIYTNESFLRNDRYIDLTPLAKYPSLKVNEYGWVDDKVVDSKTYIIQEGDEIAYFERKWLHKECNRIDRENRQHNTFFEIVHRAADCNVRLYSVPNEYCKCESCAPWFVIESSLTPVKLNFTIGWRKRVINIRLHHEKIDFRQLFPEEDTTKESDFIHAWSYNKAEMYLRKVFEVLRGC